MSLAFYLNKIRHKEAKWNNKDKIAFSLNIELGFATFFFSSTSLVAHIAKYELKKKEATNIEERVETNMRALKNENNCVQEKLWKMNEQKI